MSNSKSGMNTGAKTGIFRKSLIAIILVSSMVAFTATGCKSMNKSQKGAVIGGAGGGVVGAVVGRSMGNTALGAIIGAAVGGVAGSVIGRNMDKQAEELAKEIADAEIIREGEAILIKFKESVLFGFDRSDLSVTAKTNLDKLKATLLKYPETNIMVIGHTDSKGTESYNQSLSERRANSVTAYTNEYGINWARLTAKGMGEMDPIASNDTEDGSAANRRVEFVITANEKMKEEAKKQAGR